MKHWIWMIGLLGWFALSGSSLFAQEASIKAELSTATVYSGQPFKLRITIENHQGRFIPPDLSKLQMVGGPSQSNRMSIINGEVRQSEQYTYMLIAREAGDYNLGIAASEGEQGSLSTPDIVIRVEESVSGIREGQEKWIEIGKDSLPEKPALKLKKRKF